MQQPPYNQQPYGGQQPYMPPLQQGYAQPMMQPPQTPPKKRKPWLWILALIVIFFVGYGIGSAGHSGTTATNTAPQATTVPASASTTSVQPTTAPAKPTAVPKAKAPTVLFQQSGNGELTSKPFTAPASWTLSWSCTPDATVGDAPLYINVLDSTNTDTFTGDISATCKVGNASGSSQESQSGTVSLHIISGIDWTVKAVSS